MLQWYNIQGWFDFDDVYNKAVDKYDNCYFLEVGCWLGKSTTYLGSLIKQKNKNIKIIAVDTWRGNINETYHQQYINSIGGSFELFKNFQLNIFKAKLHNIIIPFPFSLDVLCNNTDIKYSFIYIDAGHTYKEVISDINHAEKVLIEKNGMIAGHDYNEKDINTFGVVKAVQEKYKDKFYTMRNSWVVE